MSGARCAWRKLVGLRHNEGGSGRGEDVIGTE